MSLTQPKNLRRMITRSLILAAVAGAMILGYRYYSEWSQDIDLPATADTAGFVSAIEYLDNGSHAIIIKPDGKKIESPGYTSGKNDKDAVWRPDGNRVFFISDREEGAQNVFRWNIGGNTVSRRTYNSRSKGLPSFPPAEPDAKVALITSGGTVVEFDSTRATTRQILPPIGKERAVGSGDEGDGSIGQFDAVYRTLGQSFKEARWTLGRKFVAAVMRREDDEVLIIQDLAGESRPIPFAVGQKIEIDVDPKSGRVFFLVLKFGLLDPAGAPPEFIKNGKIVLPFRHAIGFIDVDKLTDPSKPPPPGALQFVAQSNSDDAAFHRLSVSPDGTMLMVIDGSYSTTTKAVTPRAIVVMPAEAGGAANASFVLREKVYETSWHPNSDRIAFIKYDGDERAIYAINRDGSGAEKLSSGGNFGFPRFSPQSK